MINSIVIYIANLEKDSKSMTPQAFSYGTLANNGMIYMPPYGLDESLDYMLKLDPNTYTVSRIKLNVSNSYEKWTTGTVVDNKIYFLPFNEDSIFKEKHDEPAIGRSLMLDPHRFSFTWLTTSITEILENQDDYVKFRTRNSNYELWKLKND